MGDVANGHACDAFVIAFADDIVTKFHSKLLDQTFGDKLRYYVMADTNWEVRLYAAIAIGTGSEETFLLAGAPIFCPTSDDIIEQTADALELDEEDVRRRLENAALLEAKPCTGSALGGSSGCPGHGHPAQRLPLDKRLELVGGDGDIPDACECDNTHEQNSTVCRFCWAYGRRLPTDPEVPEPPPDLGCENRPEIQPCPGWCITENGDVEPCRECNPEGTAREMYDQAAAWARGLPRHPQHQDHEECSGCCGFDALECIGSSTQGAYAFLRNHDCGIFDGDGVAQDAARSLYAERWTSCATPGVSSHPARSDETAPDGSCR